MVGYTSLTFWRLFEVTPNFESEKQGTDAPSSRYYQPFDRINCLDHPSSDLSLRRVVVELYRKRLPLAHESREVSFTVSSWL